MVLVCMCVKKTKTIWYCPVRTKDLTLTIVDLLLHIVCHTEHVQ